MEEVVYEIKTRGQSKIRTGPPPEEFDKNADSRLKTGIPNFEGMSDIAEIISKSGSYFFTLTFRHE